jgi:hypothetical protein
MNGWAGQLPSQLNATDVEKWTEGFWFRCSRLGALSIPDANQTTWPAIGKIKTIRSPEGGRIVVLWLDQEVPQKISIQVYSVNKESHDMMEKIRWMDGYAIGHPVDDEDGIYLSDGSLDESAMIAAVYESLENMEYALVTRRELINQWKMYTSGGHDLWPLAPWMECELE